MNGVFPEQGSSAGGTQVIIVGHHLGGATAVHFGARPALSFMVIDDQTVNAVAPSGNGVVPVSVTTPSGTDTIGSFFYLSAPRLSGIAPGGGPLVGGGSVTLTGVNLSTAQSVHFGDATVLPTVLSDQRLTVVAPPAAVPSTVPVYAVAVGGVSNRLLYIYAAVPAVFGVTPASGPIAGGTTVVVSGTGLAGASSVTFGGFAASSFRSYSDTLIVAVTPPGRTGPAAVTVTTAGGSTTLPNAFTYQAASATVVTSDPTPSVSGEPVAVTATVTGVPTTSVTPTGTITFDFGDGTPGVTAPLADGAATVTHAYAAPSGSPYSITAVYNGDSVFHPSTGTGSHTVAQAATTTTVTSSPDPSVFGQPVTLTATVAAVPPGTGTPTGSVTFTVSDGGTAVVSLDSAGVATFVTGPLSTGSHAVTAVYSGDASFTSSTGTDTQTVNQSATTTTATSTPDPSTFGQTLTLTATVAAVPPGAGIPTGSVTFTISGTGGGTLTGALNAGGVATVTSSTLAAGTHTITAVYGGAVNFSSSTGTDTQTVNPASPTVSSLTPTSGTAAGGSAFTLTGTNLTGAAVTFGGTAATPVTVNAAGTVLTGTTPAHAPGNVIVQVTTAAGTTTVPGGYTYTLQRAYITNQNSNSVSVINTATNLVIGTPITVGSSPQGVAITPNSATAYVANFASNSVSVINTGSNTVIKTILLGTGHGPQGMAITPNGASLYVTNQSSTTVSVIDTATNAVIGSPITVGTTPSGVAITPNGTRAYVTNFNSATVSVINTATNLVIGSPITVGTSPYGVAITPDGTRAYVTNQNANSVSVINTATNLVIGSPITVGTNPRGVAITPDGTRAYVANFNSATVSVINTATNLVIGSPITVGANPIGVAITPDGTRAYVTNNGSTTVSVINTATNLVIGTVTTGTAPDGVAVTTF
ncbi:Ig-like domain repeat protein [Streptomyces violaceusniger]|uniref:Ig-like domain repeat protein n=1 Tax=Streptomyces violaceusniger TaxID=68280 RepID=UPI0036CFDDAD